LDPKWDDYNVTYYNGADYNGDFFGGLMAKMFFSEDRRTNL